MKRKNIVYNSLFDLYDKCALKVVWRVWDLQNWLEWNRRHIIIIIQYIDGNNNNHHIAFGYLTYLVTNRFSHTMSNTQNSTLFFVCNEYEAERSNCAVY